MVLQRLTYKQNLLIDKGSPRTFSFVICEGLVITAAAAAVGDDSLTVEPLDQPLSDGDRLAFGKNNGAESLVVWGPVPRGATTIQLSNTVTFALSAAAGNLSGYKVSNLTGYTVAAQIRADWSSAVPLATFTCTVDSTTNGQISATIAANADLAPNIDEKEALSLTDDILQSRRRKTGKKAADGSALPDDYIWDLDLIPSGGDPQKTIEGLVLVSGEATQ